MNPPPPPILVVASVGYMKFNKYKNMKDNILRTFEDFRKSTANREHVLNIPLTFSRGTLCGLRRISIKREAKFVMVM
jgi:hypothetical protein